MKYKKDSFSGQKFEAISETYIPGNISQKNQQNYFISIETCIILYFIITFIITLHSIPKMGNSAKITQQSKNKKSNNIYKSLSLQSNLSTSTESSLHQQFLIQFINKNKKGFDRKLNPFCPIHIKVSENWMTCCFISPLMAIASPLYIFDNNDKFKAQCEVIVFNGKQMQPLKIQDAILIKKNHLCLVILEKPILSIGWMGISYVDNINSIQKGQFKIVDYPDKIFQNTPIHVQQVKEFNGTKKSKLGQHFILNNKDIIGSILVKIDNKIPLVVGIQINDHEALVFNEKLYKKIREKIKYYIDQRINYLMQDMNENHFNEHRLSRECSNNLVH